MKNLFAIFIGILALALNFPVHAQTAGITTGAGSATISGQYVTIKAPSAVDVQSPLLQAQNIKATGSVTAAKIYTQGLDVGNELINQKNALADKASLSQVNAINEQVNVVRNSVTNLNDTVVRNNVDTNARIDVTNAALATETATRTSQVNNLEARKADKVYVDDKIVAEENARIAGDVAILNAANHYTDSKSVTQSAFDRAYTDQAVASERDRALAAEAALGKEIKQVGAMAMAAAGVAGATPAGDKKTAVTAAVGGYSGQTAIAVGVTHLVKENARLFGAFSKVSGGKTGVTVGASFSF